MHWFRLTPLIVFSSLLGCGAADDGAALTATDAGTDVRDSGAKVAPPLYASEVVDFSAGQNAGYGQEAMPDAVLGPPVPGPNGGGSLDVLSLGAGGSITLGFTPVIVDGPGDDFVVFENSFEIGGDPTNTFKELAQVSVSTDGTTWHHFDCDPAGDGHGAWPGCAGWRITEPYDARTHEPLDPTVTGGDPFDLAELGLSDIGFIRITDLSTEGVAPSAGFDLDAIGVVHR